MNVTHIFKSISIILVFAWLVSCKSGKTSTSIEDKTHNQALINKAVNEYFTENDSVEIIPNKEENLILYVSNKTLSASEPVNEVKFLVYDKANNKIVYKNQFARSKVKWFDNKRLMLIKQLGIVDKETGKGFIQYLIDIETSEMKEYTPHGESLE